METGYEIEPGPIGRSSGRRTSVVVGAIAIFLTIVVAKPWAGPAVATSNPQVEPSATVAVASPALATWPAASSASDLAVSSASRAEEALRTLTIHSGTWGVGGVGVGPRVLREEPWTDWASVVPEAAGDAPAHIAIWPHTGLCAGFPVIDDRPSLVGVTAPADLVPDWRLVGWWTDGSNVANLAGSVRQVSPAGNRGISYLERTDRAPWPAGRYEFHVIAGARTVALTVCLTRRG